jgi:hypothetical protein
MDAARRDENSNAHDSRCTIAISGLIRRLTEKLDTEPDKFRKIL